MSFSARLLPALVATAIPAVVAALTLTASVVERHDVDGHAAIVRAEATRLGQGMRDGSIPRAAVPAYLDTLAALPHVKSATLVDRQGRVVAQAPTGGDEDGIEADAGWAAIDTRRGSTEVEDDRGGIEHIQPVAGHDRALVVDYDLAGV